MKDKKRDCYSAEQGVFYTVLALMALVVFTTTLVELSNYI